MIKTPFPFNWRGIKEAEIVANKKHSKLPLLPINVIFPMISD